MLSSGALCRSTATDAPSTSVCKLLPVIAGERVRVRRVSGTVETTQLAAVLAGVSTVCRPEVTPPAASTEYRMLTPNDGLRPGSTRDIGISLCWLSGVCPDLFADAGDGSEWAPTPVGRG